MGQNSTLEKKNECERERTVSPLINIIEKDKEFILEAEMAGLTRENIDMDLNDNELTITGKQRLNLAPEGYTVLHSERCPFAFKRSFSLGSTINKEAIKAKYENGVLVLSLPKTGETLPKKITIN